MARIERLAGGEDRRDRARRQPVAACYLRENAGDAAGAITAARRTLALSRDEDGPWSAAMPQTMLAQLTMHVGDRAAAVEHAQAALPVMRRLGASDDEGQLRSLLALCAIADGRLADAKDEVSRIEEHLRGPACSAGARCALSATPSWPSRPATTSTACAFTARPRPGCARCGSRGSP